MAYPTPNFENIVKLVVRQFQRKLRKNLTAAGLFAGSEYIVPDLGIKTLAWKKSDEMSGAVISMEIPALSPDTGPGYTDHSVDIPVITKDLHYDERDYLAAQRAGVDTLAADEAARAMAVELNKYLLFGNTGGPGEQKGILNHGDINVLASQTGWSTGNNMVVSLNKAVKELVVDLHPGPYVLMMSPQDSDLWGNFITNTSAQVRHLGGNLVSMPGLPSRISAQVIYEHEVTAGQAYLIEPGSDNFDFVSPIALGSTERRVKVDPITKSLDIRFMAAGTPRVRRGEAVCKIEFTR